MMLIGNVILGMGAGMLRAADFGVDPYQCFVLGIDKVLKLGYGTTFVIVNAVFLVLMLFLGYIIDFSYSVCMGITPSPSVIVRVVYFIVSILLITFSSAVIYTADMGVSTYDWIALKTAEVQKKVSFKWCRVGTDLVCVIIGLIFSIIPGIGTIVTAFLLGPLVSFFRTYCSEPFLYGKNKVA